MANDMIKVQLSLKKNIVEKIDELANENLVSRAAIVSMAVINFYKEKNTGIDLSEITDQLRAALREVFDDQNKMIDKELKYMRSISNQTSEDSFTYIHLLNSFLWKLNMSESDYCNTTENTNPVMRLAVSDGNKDAARFRESRITNDEKYGKQ